MNLHRLESIGGGGLVQSRACSGFSEWQDTCAEREWQCSHLSEHRVDVKPRGLGNTVRVLKSLKQGEWAWESVGDMGSRCISITLTHMPVKSHYLTGFDVSVLLNLLVASFSGGPINY